MLLHEVENSIPTHVRQVSAFMLVSGRMLPEVALFICAEFFLTVAQPRARLDNCISRTLSGFRASPRAQHLFRLLLVCEEAVLLSCHMLLRPDLHVAYRRWASRTHPGWTFRLAWRASLDAFWGCMESMTQSTAELPRTSRCSWRGNPVATSC